MSTFVLVHGTFGGAFSWGEFPSLLNQRRHTVYRTTLTGLGERSHLLSPEIDLSTHIQDVVNVLEFEDLDGVYLVGHSYGGVVIAGVAERVPERLAHLVYLDAIVLQDGECVCDLWDAPIVEQITHAVNTDGEGWQVPRSLVVSPEEEQDPRYKAHPWKTWTQPIEIQNPAVAHIPHTYIYCTQDKEHPMWQCIVRSAHRAQELGWNYHELASDHGPMQAVPQELGDLLCSLEA